MGVQFWQVISEFVGKKRGIHSFERPSGCKIMKQNVSGGVTFSHV